MKLSLWLLTALLILPACAPASRTAPREELRLPALFQDHMVLQRNTDAPVWGWGTPGESVSVTGSWDGKPVSATVGPDGKWATSVATPDAGGPCTLTVTAEKTIVIRDVLVGEVWICSGQSNMEWPMTLIMDSQKEIAAADHPTIRIFDVPNVPSLTPVEDVKGAWKVCTPETVPGFSAVGFFFARELTRELKVPVGLIGSNWGGTVAEAWTDTPTLAARGDFDDALARIKEMDANGTSRTSLESWWNALPCREGGDWKNVNLPSLWSAHGLGDYDGIVSYKRSFEIPAGADRSDARLLLGPIDDADEVRINGKRIGVCTPWDFPRNYRVRPNALKEGTNEILIRVADPNGEGGFSGDAKQFLLFLRKARERINLAGEWKMRKERTAEGLPPIPSGKPRWNQNTPTALYNGMIAPLVPFAIRGTIWYQGEANRNRGVQYRTLFPDMITCWRKNWGRGDFPFLFVQLAPFTYGKDAGQAGVTRDAQRRTLGLPNTGMAVTMDIGNPKDIHPRNKQEVGRRLALWALAKTYGKTGLVHSGPLYRSMKVEGAAVRISFDHVGGGLVAKGGPLTHFTIAGTDGKFIPAEAKIEGETVVVSSPGVRAPRAVRYGHGCADEPNLFNKEGLPAASFMTDD